MVQAGQVHMILNPWHAFPGWQVTPILFLFPSLKARVLPPLPGKHVLVFQDHWSRGSRETKSLSVDSKEKDELRT